MIRIETIDAHTAGEPLRLIVGGFPPVIIAVNECDPLRDDGVEFYRLLLRAGVNARCKIVMGTVHATEVVCLPCPDISREAARELAAFCAGE